MPALFRSEGVVVTVLVITALIAAVDICTAILLH